jgi:hypothetical protein
VARILLLRCLLRRALATGAAASRGEGGVDPEAGDARQCWWQVSSVAGAAGRWWFEVVVQWVAPLIPDQI